MIELSLTNKQARKVLRALSGERRMNHVDDPDIAAIYEEINRWINVADAQRKVLAPWRKVIGADNRGGAGAEKLECGHWRMLRYSNNWVEDRAKKRRCEQCCRAAAAINGRR